MRVAQHVDQRTLAHDRAEEIGALHHRGGDQQAAIGGADTADLPGCREAAMDDVRRHGFEIVEGVLVLFLHRRLMPGRAEFAAAADVGDDNRAALREPRIVRRDRAMAVVPVPGLQRQLEAAIGIEDGRRRAFDVFAVDVEIRDLRAVRRRRPELFGDHVARIETRGLGLDLFRRAFAVISIERDGLQEAFEGEIGFRTPIVCRDNVGRAAIGQSEFRVAPFAVLEAEFMDRAHDVVEDRRIDRIAARRHIFDRAARIRRVEHRIRRQHLLHHERLHRKCHERALRDFLAAFRRPRIAQREKKIALRDAFQIRPRRQGQLHRRAIRHDVEIFGREESHAADDQRNRAIGTAEHGRARGDIVRLGFVDGLRRRDRLTAMPDLHDARIARLRHRAGAEIGSEQNGVRIHIGGIGLGERQRETVDQEFPGVGIEFAHHRGVAAARR